MSAILILSKHDLAALLEGVAEDMEPLAGERGMEVQIEVLSGHSGTDAWPIQISREGVATGLVSLPLRYMHTPVETVSKKDLETTSNSIALFVKNLCGGDINA